MSVPAVIVKCTVIVSSVHVRNGELGVSPGHAAPGAPETKLAVPLPAECMTTDPPEPTSSINPFTMPVPSPIVPLTNVGGVAV